MKLSVIIPAVNEEDKIRATLDRLTKAKPYEIIVVDGGNDKTSSIAKKYGAKVIKVKEGETWRSILLNKGAEKAKGDWLLFLHADTILPQEPFKIKLKKQAAAYTLCFDKNDLFFKLTAGYANHPRFWRSMVWGDHGLFIKRSLFRKLGGYRELSVLEDLEFCRRLRRHTRIERIQKCVVTSSRRYLKRGRIHQFLINQFIKTLYYLGVEHIALRKIYRNFS